MAATYSASRDDNRVPVNIVKNVAGELEDWSKDTLNYVWDTATLEWVKMQQPVLETTDSNFYAVLDGVEGLLTDIKAIQTNKTQFVRITDGTDDADVITTDSYKGLVTVTPSHVCDLNSTSTPLAGGATFTGTAEDALNFGNVIVSVKASHASATDGLKIQFSPDGTNWDTDDVYTIPATTGKTFSAQVQARYFRVTYTNGATQQTYFRLQTMLKPYYVKPSSHRIAEIVNLTVENAFNELIDDMKEQTR